MRSIKIISKSLFLLSFFCFVNLAYSQTDDELIKKEKEEIRVSYMNYLYEQGYKPEVDSDGDIKFKVEGKSFFLMVKNKRIFTLMRYLNFEDSCSDKMKETINQTTKGYYNLTITYTKNCKGVIFSSRSFVSDPDDWHDFFNISLNSIKGSIDDAIEYYFDE